jgi:type I restriction enzyme S subunit
MNEIIIKEPMTEWKEYKLGALIITNAKSIGRDYPYSKILYLDTGSITCNNIDSFQEFELDKAPSRAKRLVKQDDIIYSSVRPNQLHYGYITNPQDNLVVSTGFVTITCNKDLLCPKFLYYYLIQSQITEYLHSVAEASTSAYPSLKPSDIEALDIEIPLLDEQRRIAAILSSLDDKIDLLHRENATLEQMAETLFRQWFVVEAKEEWEEGKLGDYVVETVGGEWGKEIPEGDYTKAVQCIRGTDIADLNVGLADKTPIRFVKESKFEKIEPRNGDIIMEISGGTENQSTGRVAYINEDVKTLFQYPIVFSNFSRLLHVNEKYTYFLYCYLKYLYDQDEFFNLENGSSGIKNLDYKALLFELTYTMPKEEELIIEFNEKVSPFFNKINKNKKQIQTLIQTRDGLLPRLMSGEVKI